MIADIETLLGYYLSKIDFSDITDTPITYGWGDILVLHKWLQAKGNESVGFDALIPINSTVEKKEANKYPLVWLITDDSQEGRNNDVYTRFDSVKLFIACNTQTEWLNSTKWKRTMPLLSEIMQRIVDKLNFNLRLNRVDGRKQYKFTKEANFFTEIRTSGNSDFLNKATDPLDVVLLELDLLADTKCLPDEYYDNFCN